MIIDNYNVAQATYCYFLSICRTIQLNIKETKRQQLLKGNVPVEGSRAGGSNSSSAAGMSDVLELKARNSRLVNELPAARKENAALRQSLRDKEEEMKS